MSLNFVRFTEDNDWEGELWAWWIQVDGNESALEELADIIQDLEEFELELDSYLPENHVDTLVSYSDTTKLKGKLLIPETSKTWQDVLYKGGIEAWVHPLPPEPGLW